MTSNQFRDYHKMRNALLKIAKDYMTPEQLRKECKKGYGAGVSYEEAIEMSYENIQIEAEAAVKGVRVVKPYHSFIEYKNK